MAVDLARNRVRHPTGGRDGIRLLQLAVVLVDMEGSGERRPRVDGDVLQPRQPREHDVDLELGTLGRRLGVDRVGAGCGQEPVEDDRRKVAQDHGSRCGPRPGAVAPGNGARRVNSGHVNTGQDGRPGRDRRSREGIGHRAHAADRDIPVTRAVADQVIEEADVLGQGLAVQVGEGPDEGIGGHDPADRVIAERRAQHLAERAQHHRPPQLVVADQLPNLLRRPQGLQDRRKDPLGERGHAAVEALPLLELRAGAGHCGERRGGCRFVTVVDQQTPGGRGRQGRKGGVAATHQPQVEAEAGNDPSRHQGDQIAVTGQSCVHAREGRSGDGSASNMIRALKDEDLPAGPGQICRGGQPVVPRTHDDVVVADHLPDPSSAGPPASTHRGWWAPAAAWFQHNGWWAPAAAWFQHG